METPLQMASPSASPEMIDAKDAPFGQLSSMIRESAGPSFRSDAKNAFYKEYLFLDQHVSRNFLGEKAYAYLSFQ